MPKGREWWYEVKKLLVSITANSLIGEDIESLTETLLGKEIKRRCLSLERVLTKEEIREVRVESQAHAFYHTIKTSVFSRLLVFFPPEKRNAYPIFFKPPHELPLTCKELREIKRLVDKASDLYLWELEGKDVHEMWLLSLLRGTVECIEISFKGKELSSLIWEMFIQALKMEISFPKKLSYMVELKALS